MPEPAVSYSFLRTLYVCWDTPSMLHHLHSCPRKASRTARGATVGPSLIFPGHTFSLAQAHSFLGQPRTSTQLSRSSWSILKVPMEISFSSFSFHFWSVSLGPASKAALGSWTIKQLLIVFKQISRGQLYTTESDKDMLWEWSFPVSFQTYQIMTILREWVSGELQTILLLQVPDKLLVFKVIIVASYNAAAVRWTGSGQVKSYKAHLSFWLNSPQIVASF